MSAPTEGLASLPGGLRLPANKRMSMSSRIIDIPTPATLIIPLTQHVGEPALPTVAVGDHVREGQLIGLADGSVSASVHASANGTVRAIEAHPVPRRGEPHLPCVVIDTGPGDSLAPSPLSVANEPGAILAAIRDGGIVGLGGAVFPTAEKITSGYQNGIHTVILNGVECESYISCDDALMRENAAAIVRGAQLLTDVLDAERSVIAIESDKPEAIQAINAAITEMADDRISTVQVPTVYPSGGEDQLVLLLTGLEVPSGGLPNDIGILVQNVGTAAAVAELIDNGKSLTTRIVTVTGEGVGQPGNYRVRIGTPIADVIAAAGGYNANAKRLLVGGPMTGIALTDDATPVTKSCNCLLITGPAVHVSDEPERACIRCGECAEHCPVRLLPQTLHKLASTSAVERLESLGLNDCIECGCCDLVCPSHIPLTETFRRAKHALALHSNARMRADRAKLRYEAHATRAMEQLEQSKTTLAEQKSRASSAAIAAIVARKKEQSER